MKLTVLRTKYGPDYTAGELRIDGVKFCDTLEPQTREAGVKVKGKTSIPAGTYRVVFNLSPRFGRKLPRLVDVPNFEGILLHRGNLIKDTAGCILVGTRASDNTLVGSTAKERALCELFERRGDEQHTITIR